MPKTAFQVFYSRMRTQINCNYQQNLSVYQVQLGICLAKNLTKGKYNRTVTLQGGKPIPK